MSFEMRAEAAGDAAAIRLVHLRAFPTAAEAGLVDQLRSDGDAIVSLVAAADDAFVGHVLFSRMAVEADGEPMSALGLAPVAVLPEHQRKGIGSALIKAGLAEARSQGADIVFLLGEPEYYGRFGFAARTAAPFASPYAGPYFQALLLRERELPRSGRAEYAPAFAALR